jgi:hypothetical protein
MHVESDRKGRPIDARDRQGSPDERLSDTEWLPVRRRRIRPGPRRGGNSRNIGQS